MPKVGMEPIRRASLIKATIAEIGAAGSLEVTVSRIARRAGMSSALAHHYFGSKEAMFLAAMRHVLAVHTAEVRGALTAARGPEERAVAVIRTSFSATSFRPEVIAAWMNFYVLAQTRPEAGRLLTVYRRRLESNLRHALRPLVGESAPRLALQLAVMIDGAYLHAALGARAPDGKADGPATAAMIEAVLALALKEAR